VSALTADVSGTVAYSMDKRLIGRVPWALWGCVASLVVVLHADSRGGHGAVLALVYLALLGIALAGFALATLIERSGTSFIVEFPINILIFLVVVFIIAIGSALVGGSIGSSSLRGSLRWSMLVDPPANVYGWMLIYLGVGWIAFAVFRHFHTARPILMLTPAGVSFHRSWLRDLFIPWQDIRGVVPFEPGGRTATNPKVITLLVTRDFYEQQIAPKRSFFAPPGSEYMFKPEGEMMQVILNSAEVAVDVGDYRNPIEMRWKAFFDQPRSPPLPAGPLAPRSRLWPLVTRRLVAASHPVPGTARGHGRGRAARGHFRIRPIVPALAFPESARFFNLP
jgi:hypothetical protein